MGLTLPAAWAWTERLLGLSLALQSLDLLRVRHALCDDGPFRWSTLRRDFAHAPWLVRTLLDRLLAYRPFCLLLLAQLGLALLLPLSAHPLVPLALVATALLVCVRFRGSYNGGSDAMTLVVLVPLAVARLASAPWLDRACLGYVAAQLVLSYFVSGATKLGVASWRCGSALARLPELHAYALPARAAKLLAAPGRARILSLGIIAMECLFPLALTGPRACLVLGAVALGFHLANVWLLGLSRFLWAWLAAYPALLYWSCAP